MFLFNFHVFVIFINILNAKINKINQKYKIIYNKPAMKGSIERIVQSFNDLRSWLGRCKNLEPI